MCSDIVEDRPECPHAKGSVLGDRYVMLVRLCRGQANVTSGLAGGKVADATKTSRQIFAGKIARESQTAITSSRVK